MSAGGDGVIDAGAGGQRGQAAQTSSGQRLHFRYGADMDPERIAESDPGARFVARAWVAAAALAHRPPIGEGEEVWGILLVPGGASDATGTVGIAATTDDGRAVTAFPVTRPEDLADPVPLLAAARYWELVPAYVAVLAEEGLTR